MINLILIGVLLCSVVAWGDDSTSVNPMDGLTEIEKALLDKMSPNLKQKFLEARAKFGGGKPGDDALMEKYIEENLTDAELEEFKSMVSTMIKPLLMQMAKTMVPEGLTNQVEDFIQKGLQNVKMEDLEGLFSGMTADEDVSDERDQSVEEYVEDDQAKAFLASSEETDDRPENTSSDKDEL